MLSLRVTQRRLGCDAGRRHGSRRIPCLSNGPLKVDYAAGCACYGRGSRWHLTPTEYKLLCLMARNVGKVSDAHAISPSMYGVEQLG